MLSLFVEMFDICTKKTKQKYRSASSYVCNNRNNNCNNITSGQAQITFSKFLHTLLFTCNKTKAPLF